MSRLVKSLPILFFVLLFPAMAKALPLGTYDVYNVKDYGAVGNGTTDDTTAIQSAINAVSNSGGVVYLPRGTYKITDTLLIGDGSSSGPSAKQNVSFIGDSGAAGGITTSTMSGYNATSVLLWYGDNTGKSMLKVRGPIVGVRVEGIFFHCKPSTNAAATALELVHPHLSMFKRLASSGHSAFAFVIYGTDAPTSSGVFVNADDNLWDTLWAGVPSTTTGGGLQVGGSTMDPRTNVARNTWVNCRFHAGSQGKAIELRFADHNVFVGCSTLPDSGGVGLQLTSPSGTGGGSYPSANAFYNCALSGNVSGSGLSADADKNWFWPYPTGDGEVLPTPAQQYAIGVDIKGKIFGKVANLPLHFVSTSSSTAISNTATETSFSITYTLPADILTMVGTTLRIKAAGNYSTSGTPYLTLRAKIGGQTIAEAIVPTANSANHYGWSLEADAVVRFTSSSSFNLQRGYNYFSTGGGGTASSALWGQASINTASTQLVEITATWSVSSSSNSITMDAFSIEVLYPGNTN
jgi:Pectate lyase superfamily protein